MHHARIIIVCDLYVNRTNFVRSEANAARMCALYISKRKFGKILTFDPVILVSIFGLTLPHVLFTYFLLT